VIQEYHKLKSGKRSEESEFSNIQKPISGDCPICYDEMDANHSEEITFCHTQCGNNFHKTCWNTWVQGRKKMALPVTCVYCRVEISSQKNRESGVNEEGYVNLGNLEHLPSRRSKKLQSMLFYLRFDSLHPGIQLLLFIHEEPI
jgi:hypothetical protein